MMRAAPLLGEALVSTLIDDGVPMPVERVRVGMPAGQIGPLSNEERALLIEKSAFRVTYPAMVEGQVHIWEFQNRQRAARGLAALPFPSAPQGNAMSMEEVLAPLTQLHDGPAKSWQSQMLLGLCLLGAAGLLAASAGMLG